MGLPAALVAQEATPLLRKKDAAAAPPSRGWRFVVVGAALIATVLATLLVTARVSSRGVKLGGGYSLLNETAPIYSETGLPAALVAQEATATELQIPREVDEKTPSPALRELIDALTMGPDDDVPPPETVACSPAELAEARAAVFDDGNLDDGELDDGDFDGPSEEEHGTKRKRDAAAAAAAVDDDDVSAEPAALARRARCREAVAAAAISAEELENLAVEDGAFDETETCPSGEDAHAVTHATGAKGTYEKKLLATIAIEEAAAGYAVKQKNATLANRAGAGLGGWGKFSSSASSAVDAASTANGVRGNAQIIAAEGTGDFCWKDSYGRGVGKIPKRCGAGYELIGLLCYKKCSAGFTRWGLDCHQSCLPGWTNHGLFCYKGSAVAKGRGAGKSISKWAYPNPACNAAAGLGESQETELDAFDEEPSELDAALAELGERDEDLDAEEDEDFEKKLAARLGNATVARLGCRFGCGHKNRRGRRKFGCKRLIVGGNLCRERGMDVNGLLCYPQCEDAYPGQGRTSFGCCLCKVDCAKVGYKSGIGPVCRKKIILMSTGLGSGAGRPLSPKCDAHMENDAGLCYKKCRDGFDGVGPVCWGEPPTGWVNCGMGAAVDKATCGSAIADMVLGPLEIIAFAASFGTSTAATAPAKAAAKAAKGAAKELAEQGTESLVKQVKKQVVETTGESMATGGGAQLVSSIGGLQKSPSTVDTLRKAMEIAALVDPTGVSSTVAAYAHDKCDKISP